MDAADEFTCVDMDRSALQSLFGSVELQREFTPNWLPYLPVLNVLSKSEPPEWMPELFSYFFEQYVSTIWQNERKKKTNRRNEIDELVGRQPMH